MIYEVRFNVSTPIITTTEIHLDSILYAVSPAAHNKQIAITRFTRDPDAPDLPIPIDCMKIGHSYCYCCSTADYINAHKICDNATKRKDGYDYMYYHSQQTPRKGINKDYMLNLHGICCEVVSFLVSSSNLKELTRYCKRVKAIGGIRKQGYGEVESFQIKERHDLCWKDCVISKNHATRNIPTAFLDHEAKNILRCKPPYWLLDGKQQAAAVGDFVVLKSDVYLSEFRR